MLNRPREPFAALLLFSNELHCFAFLNTTLTVAKVRQNGKVIEMVWCVIISA